MRRRRSWAIGSALAGAAALCLFRGLPAAEVDDLSSARVKAAIERGQRFLVNMQNRNGSFCLCAAGTEGLATGTTSLVVLALLSSGMRASARKPPKTAIRRLYV